MYSLKNDVKSFSNTALYTSLGMYVLERERERNGNFYGVHFSASSPSRILDVVNLTHFCSFSL